MKITFKEYIRNPMGKKNAVFTNRGVFRELYKKKLDLILLREAGNIKYYTYIDKSRYIIHFKIPSEVVHNFYYDTVIEFTPDGMFKQSSDLSEYNVKFFSNDPAFVFTFAHAMIKNNIFIKDLIPKMSQEAIKKVAKEKNPNKQVGYVKSIYFAFLLMSSYNLFDIEIFERNSKPYNKSTLLSNIVHSDEKIKNRQEKGKVVNKKKREEKKEIPNNRPQMNNNSNKIKFVKNANTIRKSNKIKKI